MTDTLKQTGIGWELGEWRTPSTGLRHTQRDSLGEFDGNRGLIAVAVGGPAGTRNHIIIDITGHYI